MKSCIFKKISKNNWECELQNLTLGRFIHLEKEEKQIEWVLNNYKICLNKLNELVKFKKNEMSTNGTLTIKYKDGTNKILNLIFERNKGFEIEK